jgi:hypothetical protein
MLVFTVAWGVIGWLWGCQPALLGFNGLGDWDSAQIRAYHPSFLMDPATVEAEGDDLRTTWVVAELTTRLVLVAGSWLVGMVVLWFAHRRYRRSLVLRVDPRLIH